MKNLSKLTEEERAIVLAKREYMKKWRDANPEKVKERVNRFFSKKIKLEKNK